MATDQTVDGAAVLEHRLGHDHAVPTAEDRERGERARRELAALGAEVWATTHWWGFAIHLNAQATDTAADITELIGDVAGTFVSKVDNHYLWCGLVPSGFPGRFTALPWTLGVLRCPVDRAGDRGGAVAFTAG